VQTADLALKADSPLNPFKQDVQVSLVETTPLLGEGYNEARIEFGSAVLGLLLKLPADWRAALDAQYAHNLAKYRGLAGADAAAGSNWSMRGSTIRCATPRSTDRRRSFYDHVLIYYGNRGRFVTLGNYDTVDASVRITNQSLVLPTGLGARTSAPTTGACIWRITPTSNASATAHWRRIRSSGRGAFCNATAYSGELQAPLLPRRPASTLAPQSRDRRGRAVCGGEHGQGSLCGADGRTEGGLRRRVFPARQLTVSNRYPTPYMSKAGGRAIRSGFRGGQLCVGQRSTAQSKLQRARP